MDVDRSMQKTAFHGELETPTKEERDVQVLAKLGKKTVLKVNNPAVSCCR